MRSTARACRSRIATCSPPRCPIRCCAAPTSSRPPRCARPIETLLKGLEARGFKLTFGEDDTGFQMMYLRRGGGYYFNVGCSDMIVDGRIGLLQYDTIDRFVAGGARPEGRHDAGRSISWSSPPATKASRSSCALRSATTSPTASARSGASTRAASCATCGRPTQQEGLWFTAGSLAQCRIYSRYLALQIKAREDGLLG